MAGLAMAVSTQVAMVPACKCNAIQSGRGANRCSSSSVARERGRMQLLRLRSKRLARENRPVVKVSATTSTSLTVSLPAVPMFKDAEHSGHTGTENSEPGQAEDEEGDVCEREQSRRNKISAANKGKVPWNKGRKHSPQTIELIKQRTFQAMHTPKVIAKLKLNARHPQSEETREKIRGRLRHTWDVKKRTRAYQDALFEDWGQCLAEAAKEGGLGEDELEWNSYVVIKKKLRQEASVRARSERKRKIDMDSSNRSGKSEEHRLKIAAAIRAKWEDPEYQRKVREGMLKNKGESSKPRRSGEASERRVRRTSDQVSKSRIRNRTGQASKPRRKAPARSVGSPSFPEAGIALGPAHEAFIKAVMSDENRSRLALEGEDIDPQSESPRSKMPTRTHRRVNLLERTVRSAVAMEEHLTEIDRRSAWELSASTDYSLVDPLENEQVNKLKLIQARRSLVDKRRTEATLHARALMAEAQRAVEALEAAAGYDEFVLEALTETRRIIAEAAHFIQVAESAKVTGASSLGVTGSGLYNGALWGSGITMDAHQSSESPLQLRTQEDDDIAAELSSSSSRSIADSAPGWMFDSELTEEVIWDMDSPLSPGETMSNDRYLSPLGLFNGLTRISHAPTEMDYLRLKDGTRLTPVENDFDGQER